MRYKMIKTEYGRHIYDNVDGVSIETDEDLLGALNEMHNELKAIKKQIRDKYRNANDVFGLDLGVETSQVLSATGRRRVDLLKEMIESDSQAQQIEELKRENEKLREAYR